MHREWNRLVQGPCLASPQALLDNSLEPWDSKEKAAQTNEAKKQEKTLETV